MAVVVISGVAVAAAWCLASFGLAAVVGRTFARSERREPWHAGYRRSAQPVQTTTPLDDELPARRPVTY